MLNSRCHYPNRSSNNSICHNRSSNKYFEEQKKLTKRRSVSFRKNLPDPTILVKLKEILRTLQKNQKSLSFELDVCATTVSAYFTAKPRINGWGSFEKRIIKWILSQNMDSALTENPQDEDILQTVQLCKEIQRSLMSEENKRQVQPTLSSKVAPLNLAKLPTQKQLPPLELSQTLPKNMVETRERTSSRQYYVADTLSQFEHRPQVIMHSRSRKNSWMLRLNDTANLELPAIMETSQVEIETCYWTPSVGYHSDGKSDAIDYYAGLEFDLLFAQTFNEPQFEYPQHDIVT